MAATDGEHKIGRKEQKKKQLVKALYCYSPVNDDELLLKVNDIIEVIEETEEGWWKGILKGNIGFFPSNFVAEYIGDTIDAGIPKDKRDSKGPEKNESVSAQDAVSLNSEVHEGKQKQFAPNVLNHFEGSGKLKNEEISNSKKASGVPKKPPPPTPVDPNAPRLPPKPVKEQARVLFPYEAQNEDELTIKEGDIITILCKEIEDKGWWRGELNNHVGVFPDNFVELIRMEEVIQKKPDRPDKPPSTIAASKISSKLEHQEKIIAESCPAEKKVSKTPPAKPPPPEILRKDEKPDRPIPPHPGKKPQLPSPMKKPLRSSVGAKVAQSLSSNSSVLNNPSLNAAVPSVPLSPSSKSGVHKFEAASEQSEVSAQSERTSVSAFDALESSSCKLVHLTANRVKVPNKRPPSHVFLRDTDKENGVAEDPDWLKELSSVQNRISHQNKEITNNLNSPGLDEKPKVPPFRPSPPPSKIAVPGTPKPDLPSHSVTAPSQPVVQPSSPTIPPTIPASDNTDSSLKDGDFDISKDPKLLQMELYQMKNDFKMLKDSMVSRSEYEHLLNQVSELKETVEVQKNSCTKLVSNLKAELEEEKKLRLAAQLELERIRKLSTA